MAIRINLIFGSWRRYLLIKGIKNKKMILNIKLNSKINRVVERIMSLDLFLPSLASLEIDIGRAKIAILIIRE